MTRLRIVTPCNERWESMPVSAAGRHCGRCEKDVIDLSRLTERDALVVASLFAPGTLCGRLRFSPDGSPRHAREPVAARRAPVAGRGAAAIAVALSAAVAGCHSGSQAYPPHVADAAHATDRDPDGDRDHDGVPDREDLCPDAPEDRDGFEDADGCPDPDNDRDLIPDAADRCPNEPETFNGFEDEDGCPDRGGGILIEADVKIDAVIEFDRDAAKWQPQAAATIDEIARVFRENPDLGNLVVRGYARKDERSPKRLAQQRADNVVAALAKKGADLARMRTETPDEPDNGTRRVMFEIAPRACAIPGSHQH